MMGTEIFKIDASQAEKFTKTSAQILMTPTVLPEDASHVASPAPTDQQCAWECMPAGCSQLPGLCGDSDI